MTIIHSLGIDPGWKNLGLAVVRQEGSTVQLVTSKTLNPSSDGGRFVSGTLLPVLGPFGELSAISIERYAPYNNVFSGEAENITMLIGALRERLQGQTKPDSLLLLRAIDWKVFLAKFLFKHYGFTNPSSSLDKKFSMAAAKCILGEDSNFTTDHEADAICLAALPILRKIHNV